MYENDTTYEKLTEERFRSLERGLRLKNVPIPREAEEKRTRSSSVFKAVASVAAAVLVIGGLYAALVIANRHAPAPSSPAGETTETFAEAGDFPYEIPALTENERTSIDRLLEEIEYDLFQNGGQMLPGLTDMAAAYGLKIVKPLKERIDTFRGLDGPSAEDVQRLDAAYADILRMIIKQSGEDGFINGVREKFENNNEFPEGWTFDQAYALLGTKDLVNQIYEAKILTAERYAESIGAVSTSDKTEFSWRYTDRDGNPGYFSPRGLFGAEYPVCLYIHDVFYGIQDYRNIYEETEDETREELKKEILQKFTKLGATQDELSEITELCDKLPIDDLVRFNEESDSLADRKGDFKAIIKKYARIVYNIENGADTEQKTLKDAQIDMIVNICRENDVDPDSVLGIAWQLSETDVDEFISGLYQVIADRAATKSFLKQWTKKQSDPSVTIEIPEVTGREELLNAISGLCDEISAGSQKENVLETARMLELPDLRSFHSELSAVQDAKRELKSLVKKYALIANNYERPEQTDASNEKKDLLEHVKRICDWHGVNYTAVLQTAEPLGEDDLATFVDGLEPVIDDKAALKSYLKEWSKKAQ